MIYLDTNVFYHLYTPHEDHGNIDWLMENLSSKFQIATSEWTLIELFRALKKQENLGAILPAEIQTISDFIISDVNQMQLEHKLVLLPVKKINILESRKYIFKYNLYSSGALHLVQATRSGSKYFVTLDQKFKKLAQEIPILHPTGKKFIEMINRMMN